MKAHQIDREKWSELSVFDQMGNIGSEVGRSLAAKRRGDQVAADAAVVRALDLFDATAEVWAKQNTARTKELLRAKEQYLLEFDNPAISNGIENYFMQFAIASRLQR